MRHQSKPQLRSSRSQYGGVPRVLLLFVVAVVAFLAIEIIFFFQSANTLKGKQGGEFISDVQKQRTAGSTNDRRKSTLYKDWLLNVFHAAGRLPTADQQVVSFRMFDLRQSLGKVAGPPPFFYPVEDTLHSAMYIVANEIPVLMSWMKDLHRAQAERKTANCLDVGSNGGFFSLMSRSAGCRTLAVDAQPW
jgi:hypothetical protein